MPTKINIFKPHLQAHIPYKGGKAKIESPSGKKVHKLSSNENLLGPSPKALEAIRQHLHLLNEYPDGTDERLQEALSQFYGGALQPGQFITANSGVELLELIVYAFLDEGLECIISNPCFQPYIAFSTKIGATVRDIPLTGDDFALNVDGILAAINDNTRLIFLTSPNNPTGTYFPKANIDRLLQHVPEHVIVVYDEVYYQFVQAEDYTTGLPYVQQGKNLIAVNSFSKAYGLAGLRLGYAYSTPELAQYVAKARRPFMLGSLLLEAAIAALQDQDFIDQTVQLVNGEKPYLYEELERLGIPFWKSEANFILIKPPMDIYEFEQRLFQEGIMVRPVANFGAPGCVRVTIGTHEANEAYIAGLEKVLGNL